MNAQQEQQAIEAAQADPARFAPLYEHYFTIIFRFIHRRTGHRDLTADLTQQAFLKAMLALPRYTQRGLPFRAWLYRIALNEVRMYWRKRKEVNMEVSAIEWRGLVQEVGVEGQGDEEQRLLHLLGRLDEDRQRLIELRYFDGLSFAEVGQVLGIGEDAAKMRTHRVLKLMREQMGAKA